MKNLIFKTRFLKLFSVFLSFLMFAQGAIFLPITVNAVATETIFSDGFETNNFSKWTSSEDSWSTDSGTSFEGSAKAKVVGGAHATSSIIKEISMVGKENIKLSYVYCIRGGLESEDNLYVQWWDGTSWTTVENINNIEENENKCRNSSDWTQKNFDLSGAENKVDFKLKFSANFGAVSGDIVWFDNVSLIGNKIDVCLNIDGIQTEIPEGNYLSDGASCYPKISICTDPTATNYDNSLSDTEVSDNTTCTYTAAGTCPTVCGYAGSNDSIPDGQGGYLSCPATNSCEAPSDPANGGWSVLDPNACPTAPGSPESILTATCTNPEPSNGGVDCVLPAPTLSCPAIPEVPQICTPITTVIVSDTSDNVNGPDSNGPAVPTFVHQAWASALNLGSGATWIWDAFHVSQPSEEQKVIFTKTFDVPGTSINSASIDIASDNGYLLKINDNTVIDKSAQEANYGATVNYDIANLLHLGSNNTLEITVTNLGVTGSINPESNPAGLLYKISINGESCPVDGGWSDWSPLSCPTEPGSPVSTQTRTCTNPYPENGGNGCVGESTQICPAIPADPTLTCSEGQTGTYPDCVNPTTPAPTTVASSGGGGGFSGSRQRDISGLFSNNSGISGGEVLGASTDGSLMCEPYLKTYIKAGANNDPEEVKKLQIFLNQFFEVNNPVTGYYGPITQEMVNKFQAHQEVAILTPWSIAGLPTNGPTGYVYKTTQRWVNILKCPEMIATTPVPPLP